MKTLVITFAGALLAASALCAQPPAKKPATGAGLGKTDAASNQEMNLRAYIELLRTDVRKAKTQVIGDVMQFDADDAAKFWPIYKEFETEYNGVGDQIVALVKDYAANYQNMTGEVADRLANKLMDIDQQRLELKKKYYARVKAALDPITAARFLQVENQLEKLCDLQVAAQLPVI
ncbi:MAG TPA: hypothetical protein VMH28_27560 [Candidatus Acidoferrales bacterium]|nr:hypothetical protein [Candidatus Acidoferrales bacterium]